MTARTEELTKLALRMAQLENVPLEVQRPRDALIATHVLVPGEMKQELTSLAHRTHRTQRDLLDEAIDSLLEKHKRPVLYAEWDPRFTDTSIVFRLPKTKLEALRVLSKQKRIVQSALIREALADLLNLPWTITRLEK